MNLLRLRTLVLLLVCLICPLLTEAQTPSLQWINTFTQGSSTSYITSTANGPNGLFTLVSDYSTYGYRSTTLYKYGATGKIWELALSNCYGNGYCDYYSISPAQDGGVLVLASPSGYATKFDNNGNYQWTQSISSRIASATLDGGFHVLTSSNNDIRRFSNTGALQWILSTSNLTVNDLKTTSDDGFVITTSTVTRKYNSSGVLQWSINLAGNKILVIDPDNIFVQGSQGVIKIQLSTASQLWNYAQTGINDIKVTSDQGCVFVTSSNVVRLNSNKVIAWSSTNYGGDQVIATGDNGFAIRKGSSTIIKISNANAFQWSKTINNPNNLDLKIYSALDNGVFLTGYNYNYGYYGYKYFSFISKISSQDDICTYKVSIYNSNPTSSFCKNVSNVTLQLKLNDNILDSYSKASFLTDFNIQWKKDNVNIAGANDISYTPSQGGSYTVTIQQAGACSVTSSATVLTVINPSAPVISANYNPVCSGATTTLTASGCDNGTVVWSSGSRGTSLTSTPVSSPSYYNAYCSVDYKIGTQTYSCASNTSANYAVTTTPNSLKSSISSSENNICSTGNN